MSKLAGADLRLNCWTVSTDSAKVADGTRGADSRRVAFGGPTLELNVNVSLPAAGLSRDRVFIFTRGEGWQEHDREHVTPNVLREVDGATEDALNAAVLEDGTLARLVAVLKEQSTGG